MSHPPADPLDSSLSRRRLLETAGQGAFAALTAALGASAVGQESSGIAAAAAQPTPYTRPNVHSLSIPGPGILQRGRSQDEGPASLQSE